MIYINQITHMHFDFTSLGGILYTIFVKKVTSFTYLLLKKVPLVTVTAVTD